MKRLSVTDGICMIMAAAVGCADQGPPAVDREYRLTAIDGTALPVASVLSGDLLLGGDNRFTLIERQTGGTADTVFGSWHPVGPVEVERTFLEFTTDGDMTRWRGASPTGGDSLVLDRQNRQEIYQRQ